MSGWLWMLALALAQQAPEEGIAAEVRDEVKAAEDTGAIDTEERREERRARHRAMMISSRMRQPQDPYRILDISAYTLDRGEFRLSPLAVQVGVTPWLHLGTRLPFLATGVANLHAKLHVVRRGPADIALFVEGAFAPTPGLLTPLLRDLDFLYKYENIWLVGAGATLSVRTLPFWTVHFTLYGAHVSADLGVDLAELPALDIEGSPINPEFPPYVSGQTILIRFATDVRFNRRDALVLQGQIAPFVRAGLLGDVELEGFGGLDLGLAWLLPNAAKETWSATLSWEFHLQNADIRVGAGWSAIPGYFALQAVDIAARFGGPRRKADRQATRRLRASGGVPDGGWLHFREVEDPSLGPLPSEEPPLLDCPDGSYVRGAPPPTGFELACVRDAAGPTRNGPARFWRGDGTKESEGSYVEGERDGQWTSWHANGVLASEGAYVLGARHGSWVLFHATGHVQQKGSYDLDKMVGDWVFGREDGTLERSGSFVDGQRDGTWLRYGPDGEVEAEVAYRRGRMIRYVPRMRTEE